MIGDRIVETSDGPVNCDQLVRIGILPGDWRPYAGARVTTEGSAGASDAPEAVDHPVHYGGADDPYEAIKVIEAWDLNFSLGNAVKYISRAGKKDSAKTIEDLEKAKRYIEFEIARRERETTQR